MATPTITPLPEAPSRQNSAGTFATLADNFMSALPQFADQMNQSIDYIGDQAEAAAESAQLASKNGATQVDLAGQRALSAAQSAQSAGQQAAAAKSQADAAKGYRDTAQSAAAAAQGAAGLPALTGKGGLPLVVKPDGSGVEYSGSLRRYDLDVATTTAVLDLNVSQVFKINATQQRILTFANVPAANRAMSVVLHITGKSNVTWPIGILWNNSQVPVLGNAWTTVILIWIGDGWVGSVGARA
ncbi:hypothetical protein [Pseudomonas fulva]|uniref:hypothetical protein n=1 Tax=Pseudomonas fulva TaxID=47880 RepID=UPI000F797E95|nr:hypothetical protein [Pseudomonas fulva]MBA1209384.1 hypothetical protein [Pseudomonas fulva]MBA1217772.1 hypothetical protein [Pseudomonas fulva]MDH0573252.1 hypothetical protein [Pseudomonas fulva]RRW56916.1 hypothetical protein EGJ51_21315 [Pseudomonas fulva]